MSGTTLDFPRERRKKVEKKWNLPLKAQKPAADEMSHKYHMDHTDLILTSLDRFISLSPLMTVLSSLSSGLALF